MTDLYREIKRLTDRKKEISRKAGILKYRHVHEGSEEYVELCKEYEEIEVVLLFCVILSFLRNLRTFIEKAFS